MKRILSVIVTLTTFLISFSQSAEGRYISRMTADGVLYFIMPQQLKDLSGLKHFDYDMTLLSWTDSVTINFTFESSSMQLPENLEIVCNKNPIVCNSFSPLFVDIKKNHFEIRITSKYSISDLEQILKSITPPEFSFTQGGVPKSATYKQKVWIKDKKRLNDIMQLYYLSK